MKTNKALLYSICLMLFIAAVGDSLIFPILPSLFLDEKHGLIIGKSLISREILYGVSFALFPLAGIIGMPVFGSLSDIFGRKKVIFIGLSLVACDYLINILALIIHNIWLFLFCQIFIGFLSGIQSVSSALISDISKNDKELISNFKLPNLVMILGFILGPSFSILVTNSHPLSFTIPFIIAFILSIINLIILIIIFKKVHYINSTNELQRKDIHFSIQLRIVYKNILENIFYMFTNKRISPLAYSYLFFKFGLLLFMQSLSLYLAVTFNDHPYQISMFFIMMTTSLTVGMYVLQSRVSRFFEKILQLKLGLGIVITILFMGAVVIKFNQNIAINYYNHLIIIMCGLIYLTIPLITLNFIGLFNKLSNGKDKGKIMGGMGQLTALATFASAIFIGKLAYKNEWLVFTLSGLVIVISYWLFKKNIQITD